MSEKTSPQAISRRKALSMFRPARRVGPRDVGGADRIRIRGRRPGDNPRACYCAHYKHWRWHAWDEAASGSAFDSAPASSRAADRSTGHNCASWNRATTIVRFDLHQGDLLRVL
jgi:hypothetical protein